MIYDDSRATWGAAANTNPSPVAPSARTGVSWHYPGGSLAITPASDHARCLSQVRAWQRFHMSSHGWADIGYNALICQHARVIEGRGFDLKGAHSPGVNVVHYGVQFLVSGLDAPTPAMFARAVKLRADLEAHSGHTLRQWGHRDDPAASTACPGDTIEKWVRAGGPYAASSTTIPAPTPTTGGLSMSDVSTILARLDKLDSNVSGLRSEESGRYKVGTGRFQWLAGALNGISSKVGVDIDEAKLAAEVLAGITPQLGAAVEAAVAKLPQGAPAADIAAAVLAELGAALNPQA